jgi:hypothetical protein
MSDYTQAWNDGYNACLGDVWEKADSVIDDFDSEFAAVLADFIERLQNEF